MLDCVLITSMSTAKERNAIDLYISRSQESFDIRPDTHMQTIRRTVDKYFGESGVEKLYDYGSNHLDQLIVELVNAKAPNVWRFCHELPTYRTVAFLCGYHNSFICNGPVDQFECSLFFAKYVDGMTDILMRNGILYTTTADLVCVKTRVPDHMIILGMMGFFERKSPPVDIADVEVLNQFTDDYSLLGMVAGSTLIHQVHEINR